MSNRAIITKEPIEVVEAHLLEAPIASLSLGCTFGTFYSSEGTVFAQMPTLPRLAVFTPLCNYSSC